MLTLHQKFTTIMKADTTIFNLEGGSVGIRSYSPNNWSECWIIKIELVLSL